MALVDKTTGQTTREQLNQNQTQMESSEELREKLNNSMEKSDRLKEVEEQVRLCLKLCNALTLKSEQTMNVGVDMVSRVESDIKKTLESLNLNFNSVKNLAIQLQNDYKELTIEERNYLKQLVNALEEKTNLLLSSNEILNSNLKQGLSNLTTDIIEILRNTCDGILSEEIKKYSEQLKKATNGAKREVKDIQIERDKMLSKIRKFAYGILFCFIGSLLSLFIISYTTKQNMDVTTYKKVLRNYTEQAKTNEALMNQLIQVNKNLYSNSVACHFYGFEAEKLAIFLNYNKHNQKININKNMNAWLKAYMEFDEDKWYKSLSAENKAIIDANLVELGVVDSSIGKHMEQLDTGANPWKKFVAWCKDHPTLTPILFMVLLMLIEFPIAQKLQHNKTFSLFGKSGILAKFSKKGNE